MSHAVVVGASRGIGLGLVERLLERNWQVSATHRTTDKALATLAAGDARLKLAAVDLGYPEQLADFSKELADQAIDLLIINGAIIGPAHQQAERTTRPEVAELFDINAVAPVRCARRLLDRLVPETGLVVFISSIMGSVAENTRGDYELYRASKAALNSLARSFAAKDARQRRVGVLSLHPGWVATDLGGPDAPLTIEQSTEGLLRVIEARTGRLEHGFIDFQGEPLAW